MQFQMQVVEEGGVGWGRGALILRGRGRWKGLKGGMGWSQSGPHHCTVPVIVSSLESGVYFGCLGEYQVLGLEVTALSLTLGRRAEALGRAREGEHRQACYWRVWGELKARTLAGRSAPALGDVLTGQNVSQMLQVTEASGLGEVAL